MSHTAVVHDITVVEADEVHIWHFDDAGQVARFRHRVDTLQHHRAFTGP